MSVLFKAILEFLPLVLFLISYKFYTMQIAIVVLIVSSALALLIMKYKHVPIPKLTLFGYIIMALFGGLTIYMDDTFFIKIKPTIINIIFATVLLFDRFRPLDKKIICKPIPILNAIPLAKLNRLTLIWVGYFIFCALLNETVWRNFNEETWVYFKVFGLTTINITFMAINIFLLRSYFDDKNIKTRL